MTEHWNSIPGYEGLYEVSDLGRVRSLARFVARGRGQYRQPGRVLRPATRKSGHQHVILARHGVHQSRQVHHLVLEAFIGRCPDGMEGCHDNGNPADNSLGNLRWDTRSANVRDSVTHGTHNRARRTHCNHGHEFTPENTYRHRGYRRCKQCTNEGNKVHV